MEPEDLRARSTKVQGQEKMNAPAQVERAIHPSPRGFSFSLGSSVDWMMSAHIDKGPSVYLCSPVQILISFGNALINTPVCNVLPAI